jgi:GT2 family glycosyltransferase
MGHHMGLEIVRKEFPTVKLIDSPINLEFARACNLGIKVTDGSLIALFNNDATAEPSWLSKLVDGICMSRVKSLKLIILSKRTEFS